MKIEIKTIQQHLLHERASQLQKLDSYAAAQIELKAVD